MGQYILRRLAISVPVLLGVTIVAFLLVNLAPGDPVSAMIDPFTRAEMGDEWLEQRRAHDRKVVQLAGIEHR